MSLRPRLGLLGGTFDPIHYGHLDVAEAACAALSLDEVRFIPSHAPPHRDTLPRATPFHRFALVALAIDGAARYRASDSELSRTGPSYTVDTLRRLHADGWQPSQLFFLLGADAFAEIASWREFPAVLDAAHFAVVARPGMTVDEACARVPRLEAKRRPLDALAASAPTSTETGLFLIEARTRDVSSTLIRRRLAARESIDDLVPAAVARHILAHRLYEAVDHLHGEDQRTREGKDASGV